VALLARRAAPALLAPIAAPAWIIPVLILAAALAGCGYHLRGSQRPLALPPLALEAGPGALRQAVAARLEAAGVRVAPEAPVVLRLLGEERRRRVLSVGEAGRVAEYELRYRLRFELRRPGRPLARESPVVRETLERRRVAVFREEEALARERERERLWEALREEAVTELLRRLEGLLRGGGG